MANPRKSSGLAGALARLGRSVKEALLNRSSERYVSHLAGGDQYWDEVVQAQRSYQACCDCDPEEYYRQKEPSPSPPAGSSGDGL